MQEFCMVQGICQKVSFLGQLSHMKKLGLDKGMTSNPKFWSQDLFGNQQGLGIDVKLWQCAA